MPGFWDQLKTSAESQNQREAQIHERQMGLLSAILGQQQQQQSAYSNMANIGMGAIRDKANITNWGMQREHEQGQSALTRAFDAEQNQKRIDAESANTNKLIGADIRLAEINKAANIELENIRSANGVALEGIKAKYDLSLLNAKNEKEKELIELQYKMDKKALEDATKKQEERVKNEIEAAQLENSGKFKFFERKTYDRRGNQ